jgi:phosphoenolpyruvate carboxykinase (ATP)
MVRHPSVYALDSAPSTTDPNFGIEITTECPGVPEGILIPRNTWANPKAYDVKARELAGLFMANFAQFEEDTPPEIAAAGPRMRT